MGELTFNGVEYGIKVYPLLVHSIKPVEGLQGDIPKRLQGVMKFNDTLALIQFLSSVDPQEIGGF